MGLPQVASFKIPLGAGLPTQQSIDITGRSKILVDRIGAKLIVGPSGIGDIPNYNDILAAERLVRMRLALDRNDRRVITVGDQAVATFSQLNQGPVPVAPFEIGGDEQPTVKVNIHPNLFQSIIFTAYGSVELEIVFWGQGV